MYAKRSSHKRVLVTSVKTLRNKMNKSYLRTLLKKFDTAVLSGDKADAAEKYKAAIVFVDKSVSKGILHKNNAANKKSKMTRRLNAMA